MRVHVRELRSNAWYTVSTRVGGKMNQFVVGLSAMVFVCTTLGCSSSSGGGGGQSTGGATGSGGNAGSTSTGGAGGSGGAAGASGSGGTAGGGTGGGFGTDEQCALAPKKQQCINCCDNTHPEGKTALVDITAACICKPAYCQSVCAQSLCATPAVPATSGDACDTCFQQNIDPGNSQGCASEIVSGCQANSDCWAPYQCIDNRGCDSKPE